MTAIHQGNSVKAMHEGKWYKGIVVDKGKFRLGGKGYIVYLETGKYVTVAESDVKAER